METAVVPSRESGDVLRAFPTLRIATADLEGPLHSGGSCSTSPGKAFSELDAPLSSVGTTLPYPLESTCRNCLGGDLGRDCNGGKLPRIGLLCPVRMKPWRAAAEEYCLALLSGSKDM